MNLEKEIQDFVHAYENLEPLSADELLNPVCHRERYDRVACAIESKPPDEVIVLDAGVEADHGRIPIRIYRLSKTPNQPCCLFFHGGGWMLGNLDTHNAWAADLCAATGATVIAVDYRLGPEHPYPAAFSDCYQVLSDVVAHPDTYAVDVSRIAVYGDSAGGNLCAAVSQKSRDSGLNAVAGQVLIYPALHQGEMLPSYQTNRNAPVLSLEVMNACWRAYLMGQQPDQYAAPLLNRDYHGLPSTWIVIAQFDPLRDDGSIYMENLKRAGVVVELLDVDGLVHGCFRVRHTSSITRRAFQWSVQSLKKALDIAN